MKAQKGKEENLLLRGERTKNHAARGGRGGRIRRSDETKREHFVKGKKGEKGRSRAGRERLLVTPFAMGKWIQRVGEKAGSVILKNLENVRLRSKTVKER